MDVQRDRARAVRGDPDRRARVRPVRRAQTARGHARHLLGRPCLGSGRAVDARARVRSAAAGDRGRGGLRCVARDGREDVSERHPRAGPRAARRDVDPSGHRRSAARRAVRADRRLAVRLPRADPAARGRRRPDVSGVAGWGRSADARTGLARVAAGSRRRRRDGPRRTHRPVAVDDPPHRRRRRLRASRARSHRSGRDARRAAGDGRRGGSGVPAVARVPRGRRVRSADAHRRAGSNDRRGGDPADVHDDRVGRRQLVAVAGREPHQPLEAGRDRRARTRPRTRLAHPRARRCAARRPVRRLDHHRHRHGDRVPDDPALGDGRVVRGRGGDGALLDAPHGHSRCRAGLRPGRGVGRALPGGRPRPHDRARGWVRDRGRGGAGAARHRAPAAGARTRCRRPRLGEMTTRADRTAHERDQRSVPEARRRRRDETRDVVLALGALGVVYGDIGTNPLFAIRESFTAHPIAITEANVLGVLSLAFWSLILVISAKYVTFVMRASNDGEGGILALVALLLKDKPEHGRRKYLVLLGVFGAALLFGDGMITPAISVLAAVEGTSIAAPALHVVIVPVAVAILVGLFVMQRRGTSAIGRLFGPIMLVWFATIALLGAAEIGREPSVFRAVNPAYAGSFFARNGFQGFLVLGAVILVVVGGEALYADMGHFGRRPIAIGWYSVVLPALVLVYFGQGALLLEEPSAIANPFYEMAPAWALGPLVVLATVATVIASQALISGVFSLTQQAVQLGFAPHVRIKHTSSRMIGQIYVPTANWILLVGCIALVLGFRESAGLAGAYGVAVAGTMLITTILFTVVVHERFHWPTTLVIPMSTAFLIVDLAFFTATLAI